MHPNIRSYAPHDDESILKGMGHTYIPTYGLPASSFDAYRIVGIHSVENKPTTWALTDTDSMAALGRVIDGPITASDDIEKAESLLRALLLHDYTQVIVPCVKAQYDTGLISYLRLDKNERNIASYETMHKFGCRDLLFSTEYVNVTRGIIQESSSINSVMLGTDVGLLNGKYRELLTESSKSAIAFAMNLGASSYFSSREMGGNSFVSNQGFMDEMYKRVERPWIDVAQNIPTLDINVKLPPLMSIVLSRANLREHIPEVLVDLKMEFEVIRQELNRLNEMLDSTMPQAEIYAQVVRVNESFDAIVPEALLTDVQRRSRTIASVFNFIKPVKQLYSIASDPLGASASEFKALYSSASEAVKKDSRIVSRNVVSEKMSNLLKVESTRQSIQTHFSHDEIALLINQQ